MDTPLVERRKNWFQRQISRMGSVRSASTAYSSGGLFGRNRHNSVVYSSPEAGQPVMPPPPHHKMSLYERLVGRKSGRGQHRPSSRHGKIIYTFYFNFVLYSNSRYYIIQFMLHSTIVYSYGLILSV